MKRKEQAERREALENEKRLREQGSTFSQFAEAFADEDRGGRFKTGQPTTVVGTTLVPNYPQAALAVDPVPTEPPLGFSIEDHEPVGTYAEIQASLERLGETGLPSGQPDGSGEAQRSSIPPDAVSQTTPSPPTSTEEKLED